MEILLKIIFSSSQTDIVAFRWKPPWEYCPVHFSSSLQNTHTHTHLCVRVYKWTCRCVALLYYIYYIYYFFLSRRCCRQTSEIRHVRVRNGHYRTNGGTSNGCTVRVSPPPKHTETAQRALGQRTGWTSDARHDRPIGSIVLFGKCDER